MTDFSAELVDLRFIERRTIELGRRLGAPRAYLATFDGSRHDGTPHIEMDAAYHFVVCERGSEFERRTTRDLDELLFWIFSSVTFSMASDWEVRHRRRSEDSRRQLFSKQVELLAALSPAWSAREEADHLRILKRNPFDDDNPFFQ